MKQNLCAAVQLPSGRKRNIIFLIRKKWTTYAKLYAEPFFPSNNAKMRHLVSLVMVLFVNMLDAPLQFKLELNCIVYSYKLMWSKTPHIQLVSKLVHTEKVLQFARWFFQSEVSNLWKWSDFMTWVVLDFYLSSLPCIFLSYVWPTRGECASFVHTAYLQGACGFHQCYQMGL
jgi:hypothetical protein